MVIRKANSKDIENLVKIRLAYLQDNFKELTEEQLGSLMLQLPEYFVNHIDKNLIVYIAEEKQEFISSVFLLIIEKPANLHFLTGRIGNILNVYTKPEYRRQGLAGKLLKLAMDEAKTMNLSYLELNATKDGYPLYQKVGFVVTKSEHVVAMKYIL